MFDAPPLERGAVREPPAIAEGQPNLSQELLKSMRVPTPPLSEQAAIVEYLDKATADIDTAIDLTRRKIELMREYRTRLIADVVTGKLDAREVAANLPDIWDDSDEASEEVRI